MKIQLMPIIGAILLTTAGVTYANSTQTIDLHGHIGTYSQPEMNVTPTNLSVGAGTAAELQGYTTQPISLVFSSTGAPEEAYVSLSVQASGEFQGIQTIDLNPQTFYFQTNGPIAISTTNTAPQLIGVGNSADVVDVTHVNQFTLSLANVVPAEGMIQGTLTFTGTYQSNS